MGSTGWWLTWSWRDLRGHWVRVVVIAMIIALGTGTYAGLASNAEWRRVTADHNYDLLDMYDLRVRLANESRVPQGTLVAQIDALDHPEWVTSAEERLIAPTQVDASTESETILVRGRVIGVPVADPGQPAVNDVYPAMGRRLEPADHGQPVALIERNFAMFYDLPETGTLRLGGGHEVEYVGHGIGPEYFIVQPEGELFFSQANYAVVFTSLPTAQRATGFDGQVNDLVVTLADGVDPAEAAAALTAAVGEALPDVGTTVMQTGDDLTYTIVYEDIDNDQVFFRLLAAIIFVGAIAAAFNLTNRLVEAQRREIGIAMALGVPRTTIAVRPMLVGVQIAVLGVAFGLGVGWLITLGMRSLLESFMPFAMWLTPFQPSVFITAAAIGFIVPIAATAVPVWRAVRVAPVDAIRTGHLAARGGGLAPLIQRIPFPGDTFATMPFRNLLRAPRRAALTIVGIAAAISALVMVVGAVDSFLDTVDRGGAVATTGEPDRIIVDLNTAYPEDHPEVVSVTTVDGADTAQPALQIGATLVGDTDVTVAIRFIDYGDGMFRPQAVEGSPPGVGEILLSPKAAADIGARVGDTITVEHPMRQGPFSYSLVESPYRVSGIHDHPFRVYTYMAEESAAAMGLGGLANTVDLAPSPGTEVGDLQRSLFASSGVVSVQRADAQASIIRDFIQTFIGIFRLLEAIVILLAALIAFNAAGIGVEERKREHATMFAYGVPVWKAVRIAVTESITMGVIATVLGIVGGLALLRWFLGVAAAESMPEISFDIVLSPTSVVAAFAIGVMAVGLAPLLTAPRRLRHMDVPSTLRVME